MRGSATGAHVHICVRFSSLRLSLLPVRGVDVVRMEREAVVWRVSLQADCKSQSESVRSRSGQVKAKRED